MRSLIPACLLLSSTILGTEAIHLQKRTDGPQRVVHQTIQRKHVANAIKRDRLRFQRRAEAAERRRSGKRDDTISVDLTNDETLYFMNITMGTPAQTLAMHIDTGSSDLWVNVASSTLCSGNDDPCSFAGTYSPNKSSTYSYVNSAFDIEYVDGSGAEGDYATDVVRFTGATIDDQQFGIGYTSSSDEGVMGIGYITNEASISTTGKTYPNVPKHLLDNGDIAVNAYSLWLNDLDASTGSILFGGVNKDKYTGTLETLPILTEEGEYAEFIIALTAVGANGTDGSLASDLDVAALLDSGSSLLYLPNNVTQKIYDDVGAEYSSEEGAAFVDCSLGDETDWTLDFTFSSPTIRVSMAELVLIAEEDDGTTTCILGVAPADGSTPILGDTFLRSAYVVYDLTNNEISLAQTDFNSTTDDILEITNSTGIPGASAVANAVTSVVAQSSAAAILSGSSITVSGPAAKATAALGYNAAVLAAGGLLLAAL